jgi:transposase
MLCGRRRATQLGEGVAGRSNQLRRLVRVLRPQANVALYRRLVVLPAEEAQVDWGAFGSIRIGHGTRALSGFVMVLSYSRALFALFTLDQTLESFLRGHVEAFQVFGGSARTLVYDNFEECGARTPGDRDSLSPTAARTGGTLSFRGPALHASGERETVQRDC